MSKYVAKADETKTDPWLNLANAIVIQAAKEYRSALRRLRRKPDNAAAKADADEIERFFRSGWYECLTTVPGELLIKKLKEEAYK